MAATPTVLLVNDIPDHATRYEAALVQYGFRVMAARRGDDALRLVKESLPNCVVIDLRLPDMSGWDLCRRIKTRRTSRSTQVIVLTADVSKMCVADSAKAGCNAWLAHPTVADDLARTVGHVLALDVDAPATAEDALLGWTVCPACGADQVRSTIRVGAVQYYCCKACSFCWRMEAMTPKA